MPLTVKTNKIGSISTDLESIKLIGRKIIGSGKVPEPFEKWLHKGVGDNAMKEFDAWDLALEQSFGKRRFIKMEIDSNVIYRS